MILDLRSKSQGLSLALIVAASRTFMFLITQMRIKHKFLPSYESRHDGTNDIMIARSFAEDSSDRSRLYAHPTLELVASEANHKGRRVVNCVYNNLNDWFACAELR